MKTLLNKIISKQESYQSSFKTFIVTNGDYWNINLLEDNKKQLARAKSEQNEGQH